MIFPLVDTNSSLFLRQQPKRHVYLERKEQHKGDHISKEQLI